VTKLSSAQVTSDQVTNLYPVVIVMKYYIVVVCTPKKVYHQVTSEKDDEQYHRRFNFKWKTQTRRCTVATHSNDFADMSFEFKRLQFPVWLAFAMTINKAQGQSLQVSGLNLENPCFSHGQLCGLLTRWKPFDLFVYTPEGKKILYIQKLFNKHSQKKSNEFYLN
jgi:hypothetical protein